MMKWRNIYLLFVFHALHVCCTSIHEFPYEDEGTDIDQPNINLRLDFSCSVNKIPYSAYSSLEMPDSSDRLRYVIEIYEDNGKNTLVDRRIIYDDTLVYGINNIQANFQVCAKKYKAAVWVEFLYSGATNSAFYSSDSLSNIYYNNNYTACTEAKDALSNLHYINLLPYKDSQELTVVDTMELLRPVSKFELISNDVKLFLANRHRPDLDLSKMHVEISYEGYFLLGYNALWQKTNSVLMGLSYTNEVQVISNDAIRLTYDYILMNDTHSFVPINILIYDDQNILISRISELKIPITKDALTTVESNFLTRNYGSGINIDPDFGGEFNVVIPD